MIEKPDEKKNKKVVDKQETTWYYIKVASESNNKVPWQINSNATLKIPKFIELSQFSTGVDWCTNELIKTMRWDEKIQRVWLMEDDADHNKSINTNKCDENHNPK